MMVVGGEWQAEHCFYKNRFVCFKRKRSVWKVELLVPNLEKEVVTPFIDETKPLVEVVFDDTDKVASILTQR